MNQCIHVEYGLQNKLYTKYDILAYGLFVGLTNFESVIEMSPQVLGFKTKTKHGYMSLFKIWHLWKTFLDRPSELPSFPTSKWQEIACNLLPLWETNSYLFLMKNVSTNFGRLV